MQSRAFSQAPLFVDSYGANRSLVQHQITDTVNLIVAITALNYTHDADSRELMRTERGPVANPATIPRNYDPRIGTLRSETFPTTTLKAFQYDAASI